MADQVIYQTQKSLGDLNGSAVDGRGDVDAKIAQLREAVETDDVQRIRQLTEDVQRAAMALGEAIHRRQAEAQPGGPDDTAASDEDIIEGEYEAA